MQDLQKLTDDALIRSTEKAVAADRNANVAVIAHLAEMSRRKLYRDCGYPSLFAYCVGRFHMSKEVAYKRTRLAELSLEFPRVLEALRDGRMTMRALTMVGPHLTAENSDELLEAAFGKTRDEVDCLLARRFPRREEIPTPSVRKLPTSPRSRSVSGAAHREATFEPPPSSSAKGHAQHPHRPMPTPARRPEIRALTEEVYKVQFPATARFKKLLTEVQDLVRHRIPDGDMDAVLSLALETLKQKVLKERFGIGAKVRRGTPSDKKKRSRHIPREVAREVYERDGGRCTFVSKNGARCDEAGFLEIDHVVPFAQGGSVTRPEDARLLCRAHNQLEAERRGLMRPMRGGG